MTLLELVEKLSLEVIAFNKENNCEVNGLYVGDLLSWVMGHAEEKNAWATVQTHDNIIAVALLKELSCIIIVDDAHIPQETIDKANENNLAIFRSTKSAYDLCVAYASL